MTGEVVYLPDPYFDKPLWFICDDGHQHVFTPGDRCTATTTKGRRCKNWVFGRGQVWGYGDRCPHDNCPEHPGARVYMERGWQALVIAQLCELHFARRSS